MSNFHIVHVIPDSRLHILNGYNEVIKSLIWGLRCHGHEVSYAVNTPRQDARNLVLGANMAQLPIIDMLPPDSIIYNLEQVSGLVTIESMAERLRLLAQRFTIWDYSETNISGWKALNQQCELRHVPIGYAPILSCIEKPEVQDIDALIYGGPGDSRLKVFTDLCLSGLTVLFVFGLYDKARDDLIARSKLVLNISHGVATVFSIVRTSYLLANRKAVIADAKPGLQIDSDLIGALQFTELDRFVEVCHHYINDDAARARLEEQGFETFARRDIRVILGQALAP
jgi:hypothetical protein